MRSISSRSCLFRPHGRCGDLTECFRWSGIQPPFPLMPKEKTAGGEKETSKGGFASEQTPHPSSCPPLAADRPRPFRCSSSSHTNRFAGFAWEPCPFCNPPLKRPRRGAAAPPSLDFPRSSVCAEIISDLQNAIQMRIWQTGEVIEILCGCFGCILYGRACCVTAFRLPYVKYSTGAKKRFARSIVRLGNPILRPPEGRFDDGNETTKRKTERQTFQARKRYFASSVSFLHTFF